MKFIGVLGLFLLTAVSAVAQPLKFEKPVALPEMINSSAEEVQPVFNKELKRLYFVRAGHPDNQDKGESGDQDIWRAYHDSSGNWVSVEACDKLNNEENNGIFGFSADYKTAYLLNAYLKKKHQLTKGVAVADWKGKDWHKRPETLKIEDFTLNGDHYSFYLGHKDDVLLISEMGDDSRGSEDLYISLKSEDGTWGKPMHMGDNINSTGYEMSPFLTENEDTLFFASNGHGGFGDADIFYSVRQGEGWNNWSDPVNLGPEVNSESFEAYFIWTDEGAYFTSNRAGSADIYHTELAPPEPIVCRVTDSKNPSEKGVNDGSFSITNLEPSTKYDQLVFLKDDSPDTVKLFNLTSTADGRIDIPQQYEGRYHDFKIFREYRKGECEDVALLVAPEPIVERTPDPIPLTETVEGTILFDLNSSFLDRQARKALTAMLPKLKSGAKKIQIVAHTDYRESDKYNMWLSERRMNRVKSWMEQNGISGSIISGDFRGEKELIHQGEDIDEELHHANRRATIVVSY